MLEELYMHLSLHCIHSFFPAYLEADEVRWEVARIPIKHYYNERQGQIQLF